MFRQIFAGLDPQLFDPVTRHYRRIEENRRRIETRTVKSFLKHLKRARSTEVIVERGIREVGVKNGYCEYEPTDARTLTVKINGGV